MFTWFRLFESTAQYVDLVQSTIKDIANFMLVFIQILMMFGFAFYMIQISMYDHEKILYDYNEDEESPSFMWYALVNQVSLIMGDFGTTHLDVSLEYFSEEE